MLLKIAAEFLRGGDRQHTVMFVSAVPKHPNIRPGGARVGEPGCGTPVHPK
jgi:hypothetical protein